ncbi:MAG: GNAT family N-acetyltransferase [Acaryochloridaceae cyanobacterium SU_2_1]|nr:GNAT family N-acetyltransferase [Acaryochloridaceae cyanobacterium SU_2_1]
MVEFAIAFSGAEVALGYSYSRYCYALWSLGLEAKLEDLWVMPTARDQGVGTRLLKFAIALAHQRDCRLIGLNTNEQNGVALHLYEKQGFSAERCRWPRGRQLWLEKPIYD